MHRLSTLGGSGLYPLLLEGQRQSQREAPPRKPRSHGRQAPPAHPFTRSLVIRVSLSYRPDLSAPT